MSWQEMRIRGGREHGGTLPGERGRYVLLLEPPLVQGEPHYVHFSWKDFSFCIRDYIQQLERRQAEDLTPTDVWDAALDRIPCKGELYVPVENFEFWRRKLTDLTEERRRGLQSNIWSRLSSRINSRAQNESHRLTKGDASDQGSYTGDRGAFYGRFTELWRKRDAFDVAERTVGCSARYAGEPLLWVYPTHFQIAPRGKGNAHYGAVLELKDRFFPESTTKATVGFDSSFEWDRFQGFVTAVQDLAEQR